MESQNVSAVISAVAGITGVLLGNSFVAIKEWLVNRRKRKENEAYISVLVVSHLESFADSCASVAGDDGTDYGRPAGDDGIEHVVTVRAPDFKPQEFDVDWKAMPKELMFQILWLPEKQRRLHLELSGISDYEWDPPFHTEYFWTRRHGYAGLGLTASRLARELRDHVGMPHEGLPQTKSNRDQYLVDVAKDIDTKREAYRKRQSAVPESPN